MCARVLTVPMRVRLLALLGALCTTCDALVTPPSRLLATTLDITSGRTTKLRAQQLPRALALPPNKKLRVLKHVIAFPLKVLRYPFRRRREPAAARDVEDASPIAPRPEATTMKSGRLTELALEKLTAKANDYAETLAQARSGASSERDASPEGRPPPPPRTGRPSTTKPSRGRIEELSLGSLASKAKSYEMTLAQRRAEAGSVELFGAASQGRTAPPAPASTSPPVSTAPPASASPPIPPPAPASTSPPEASPPAEPTKPNPPKASKPEETIAGTIATKKSRNPAPAAEPKDGYYVVSRGAEERDGYRVRAGLPTAKKY